MKEKTLIPHLFRTEFSKIVAVLCKKFGLANMQLAEDIVSATFLVAVETWGLKGVPKNPSAWLYKVAQNKVKDYFKRNKIFNEKIKPALQHSNTEHEIEINLSDKNIIDSQLQMIFAICNPAISTESQIALALRILCGFGVDEIAQAFLTNKATINKRLFRAKDTLRKIKADLAFPKKEELESRLNNALSVIYLLFNEGYYSSCSVQTLKKYLCLEAMHLTHILLDYQPTNQPKTNALMALFCFHSSRFQARMNKKGQLILYDAQDKKHWDYELIKKGEHYLGKSAKGSITKYHLEAGISFWHTKSNDAKGKWDNILQYYNQLLQIDYSPMAALNRTYALSVVKGKHFAITEALKINLKDSHLYHSLLAELYKDVDEDNQIKHLKIALELVKTENEKQLIQQKLNKAL